MIVLLQGQVQQPVQYQGSFLDLPANIRLGRKSLTVVKRTSLFNNPRNEFYSKGPVVRKLLFGQ